MTLNSLIDKGEYKNYIPHKTQASNMKIYSLKENLKSKSAILRATTDSLGHFQIKLKNNDFVFLISDEFPFTNTIYNAIQFEN